MKTRRDLPSLTRTVTPGGREAFLVNGSAAGVHLYAERRSLDAPIAGRDEMTTDVVVITIPYSEFVEIGWSALEDLTAKEASV